MKETGFMKLKRILERRVEQIKRVIDFLPIIWKGYDFDYYYTIELFKHQLQRQAKYFESKDAYSVDSKLYAQKIRTAIRLIDKVYDDEYAYVWQQQVEERWGKGVLDFDLEEDEEGRNYLEFSYRKQNHKDRKQIDKDIRELSDIGIQRQKRAHKLLWEYIEWNIQRWWD